MTDGPGADSLLRVEDLSVSFPALRGERTSVLDRVSFEIGRQETVALVGESGSGKTVTALTVMGLNHPSASVDGGRILLEGSDLLEGGSRGRRDYRGTRIGMIFQSPKASLNPLVKAGAQVARVVRLHQGVSQRRAHEIAVDLMRSVGINDPERRYHAYAHQLSGGMAQRVMIAMALSSQPELLIADEPTTGLDVTIQEQIFELLLELKERLKMSILLITHDLALVAETSDRVVVMHGGHVVENGPVEAIFDEPKHPVHAAARRLRPPGRPAYRRHGAGAGDTREHRLRDGRLPLRAQVRALLRPVRDPAAGDAAGRPHSRAHGDVPSLRRGPCRGEEAR